MRDAWRRLARLSEVGGTADSNVSRRQWQWLSRCLARNRHTDAGRRYRFGDIDSADQYRALMPMVDYEDMADQIARIEAGDANILFAGLPVAFERTGGSNCGPKLIPYSAQSLTDFRRAIIPWLVELADSHALDGPAYWAISPAARQPETSGGGVSIGLTDGAYLGPEAAVLLAELSAVPPWLSTVENLDDWHLATAYWLLRCDDLAMFSVWSPTLLTGLLDTIDSRATELEDLLANGGRLAGHALERDPAALARFAVYMRTGDTRILWPKLRVVSCWADGSSQPYFDALIARLPHSRFQPKGLIATEGVVTVPDSAGKRILAVDHGFFEFIDHRNESRLAHEVCTDEEYEVVITTAGGLYRYRTGDRVRCNGYSGDVPSFEFIGRGNLTCDLVGEKLTESFVADCLKGIVGFRMLIPALTPKPHYKLITEATNQPLQGSLAGQVENRLRANPQYAYARDLGQLGQLCVAPASEPLAAYVRRASRTRQRLGDIKVPALQPEADWLQTFSVTAP